jgi:hypothetical protein
MKSGGQAGTFRAPMRRSICLLPLLVAACGPDTSSHESDAGGGGGPDAPPAVIDAAAVVDAPPGPDGAQPDFSKVYVHSGQMLYRLDTATLEPLEIGPFANLGGQSMTDIAVDKDDRMLGITLDKIYTVDVATGTATLLAQVDSQAPEFTSLSFVPVDLDDPESVERLVAAADDGTVYEIDPDTGGTTQIGSYGSTAGGLIKSSGDIVAVRGLGIYATVTIGDPLSDPDYLARIDPATWEATPLGIGTDYDKIFGVGFWRDTIYGFVDRGGSGGGAIVTLDPNTGASVLVDEGAIRWFGAGVTTDAPIIP